MSILIKGIKFDRRALRQLLETPAFQLGLVLAVTLAARLFYLIDTGFATDDAFITFRYARMLAGGQGFVYNTGERVYGTTTPLFTLLLAAGIRFFQASPLATARVLGITASLGTAACTWLAARRLGAGTSQQLMAGLALALCISQWGHDTNGMETALLPCLMAASWLFAIIKRPQLSGLVCGLLLWTRIDTVLWPVVLVAAAAWKNRGAGLRLALVTAGVYLPWIIFSVYYFGSPLPHTILAKQAAYAQNGIGDVLANLWMVVKYLTPIPVSPSRQGLLLVTTGLVLGLAAYQVAAKPRSTLQLALAAFLVLETARLALSGATFFNRYFVPVLWAALTAAALGLGKTWDRMATIRKPSIFWTMFWPAAAFSCGAGVLSKTGSPSAVFLLGLLPVLLFLLPLVYLQKHGLQIHWIGRPALIIVLAFLTLGAGRQLLPSMSVIHAGQVFRNEESLKAMGEWLAENSLPGSSVLLEPLGYVGYYSGRLMLDEVGLVTPAVTRFKQAGNLDVYSYLVLLRPDFIIQHCDDILEWQRRDTPATNLLTTCYEKVARFDPLNFDPSQSDKPGDGLNPLRRQACYEIWSTNAGSNRLPEENSQNPERKHDHPGNSRLLY